MSKEIQQGVTQNLAELREAGQVSCVGSLKDAIHSVHSREAEQVFSNTRVKIQFNPALVSEAQNLIP